MTETQRRARELADRLVEVSHVPAWQLKRDRKRRWRIEVRRIAQEVARLK